MRPYRRLPRPDGSDRPVARGGVTSFRCMDLAVPFDVERRHTQQERVVAEQAQPVIAPLAQQPADSTGEMIMIQVLGFRRVTDGAQIPLLQAQLVDFRPRHSVLAKPVRLLARGVVTSLATRAEARRQGCVPDVVIMSDGLPAGGTPSETVRHPRQIPHVLPEGLTLSPIPLVAARPVACPAVEREAVRLSLVPTER